MPRSPYLFAIAPAVALGAGVVRWVLQGSGNLYTATAKRFYVPDPDLGYRVSSDAPLWLGLEVLAALAAVTVGVLGAGWVIRRRERKRGPWPLARWVVAIGALAPLPVPVLAFATGLGPLGALEALPQGEVAAPPTTGIEGNLSAPAGRYEVIAHAGTSITARVSAGKEEFDARFGAIDGFWQGAPGDLTQPMTAEASAAVASVDTGNSMRSSHARDEYLLGAAHPRLGFRLGRLIAARQDGPTVVAFRAEAVLQLKGVDHPVEITGSLRAADAAAQGRLGTTAPTLVVNADTAIQISTSALASDADSFDTDRIPLHVSLVLVQSAR